MIGAFNPASTPSLTLSRQHGLLILHPDILVSSTKVSDSSHCARKALLQELIRTVGGLTPSLAYGNMLHEMLQDSLLRGQWDEASRTRQIEKQLAKRTAELWSMDLPLDKAREEMTERSKAFADFSLLYIGDKPKVSLQRRYHADVC